MIYLKSIILYFPPAFISKNAESLLEEMKSFSNEDKLELVKSMGIAFIKSKPGRSNLKL